MAQIADSAGVAVQTVYFAFHTKAALLSRAYDFAVMGEEEPRPPEEQAWFQAMLAEPDVVAALHHFVSGAGEIIGRVTPLEVAARVAADADADTARVMAFHERWRVDSYRDVVQLLATKAEFRNDMTLERASDLFLLLVGIDVYRFVVLTRGWSHESWVKWAVGTLASQVFGATGSPAMPSVGPSDRSSD